MKRLISIVSALVVPAIVLAQGLPTDHVPVSVDLPAQIGVATNSATSGPAWGIIESIGIKESLLSTCTVTVVTGDITLLTVTPGPTAANTWNWYRVRYPISDASGVAVPTNLVNELLVGDTIKATVVKTAPTGTAETVSIRVKMSTK